MTSIRGLLLGLALSLLACGCGKEEKLTPVHGRVYYRGQPLAGGTIVFTPDPERGGRGPLATAEIEADGRYVLRTEQAPGAVAGWHRVSIAPPPDAALPGKYGHPEQSGLLREVKPGKVTELDFHLD